MPAGFYPWKTGFAKKRMKEKKNLVSVCLDDDDGVWARAVITRQFLLSRDVDVDDDDDHDMTAINAENQFFFAPRCVAVSS